MTFDVAELKKSLQRDPKNSGLIRELGNYYLANGLYRQAREEYHLAALFSPRITAEILADFENTIEKNTMDIQSRLCLISFLLSQNEIDPAILELEELIDIDPKNLQAYNILGKIYIKMGRADDVMTLLEKALKMGVKDLSISEMLAWVYLEKKRFEEAIKFYEELPKNKKTQRTLAELYQIVGKLDKSAEKYYEMYSLDPEVATEVTIKLEELLAKDVTSISIRELLFQIYAKNMHPDLAVKKLSEIIKISPQKTDELIERLKDLLKNYPLNPEATLLLSELHAQKGDYSESIEEYSNLIKNKPDLIEKAIEGCKNIVRKYPDQFLAREFLIETYLSQGKYEEAVFEVRFLLKTYPETSEWIISKCRDLSKRNMELKECLGYAYLAKNEYALANIEAENLLAQNRQNISALLLLGEVFLKQKLCRKATETFLKAMNIAPFDKSIHAKYKDAKMKELELEAEQIKKRIQEDEWKISFHLDLGKNCLLRGQKEEALRELQIAAKDTQRAAAVHLILGNFYRNEGLYDQSLDAFRKSLQYCPQESVEQLKNIKFNMALTYEAQGQIKYSIKMLEEIEQEDIDFPGLKEKLKYLKNTNLTSLQSKSLVLFFRDMDSKDLSGIWGRESKKQRGGAPLSVSFGQNYNNSGMEFFLKGMHSAAEEEFTLSAQLDPHYIPGNNNYGATLLIGKKFNEGLSALKKISEIEPSYSIILNNLGVALLLTDNKNEAEKTFLEAIQSDPELSSAKLNLADLYYETGKVEESIRLYREIPIGDILYDTAQNRLLYRTNHS